MAQINLGFAESGMVSSTDDLMSYEKTLVNQMMERDDFVD